MRICTGELLDVDTLLTAACTVLYWPLPSFATVSTVWPLMLLQSAVPDPLLELLELLELLLDDEELELLPAQSTAAGLLPVRVNESMLASPSLPVATRLIVFWPAFR